MKNNMYLFEEKLINKNYKLIAGIDEVGRGCLAGPIVVAICILPLNYKNIEIKDSKKISERKRNILEKIIKNDCVDYFIYKIDSEKVDILNPKKATIFGMEECVKKIRIKPDFVLIDAENINIKIDNESIIKGDDKSISIAAASILAKVYRDNYMKKLSKKYPEYHFERHKGYGTKQHIDSINKFGPIKKIHRFSYKPIRK